MPSTNNFCKKYYQSTHIAASVLTVVAATTISTIAQAGTIRHDRSDSQYTNLANSFPSVGYFAAKSSSWFGFQESTWGCSGTLIDSAYVLTAAHCVQNNNQFLTSGTFTIGDNRYAVKSAFWNSAWNPNNIAAGNDLAILRLVKSVSNVQPATLYSDFNENSKIGTYVGFGATGNGLTGSYLKGGTKRAGENLINLGSKYGSSDNLLISDFSVPSSVDIFEIKNIGGKCLDVQWGEISKSGTPTWLWDCNKSNAQKWYRDGSQIKTIGSQSLDVQWSNFNNGTPIHIWENNGTKAQQWSSPNFNSYDKIQNVGGKCLDVQWGEISKTQTPIWLWDCNGTDAQKWKANNLLGLGYKPNSLSRALDLEYQLAQGDSGGGLFIDGKVAGIHSFIRGIQDNNDDATYTDLSVSTRVSPYVSFIDRGKKRLENLLFGFITSAKPSDFAGGGSWIHAPLEPEFDWFDESFQVSIIGESDFGSTQSVPEPTSILSLLVFGIGSVSILKGKQKISEDN